MGLWDSSEREREREAYTQLLVGGVHQHLFLFFLLLLSQNVRFRFYFFSPLRHQYSLRCRGKRRKKSYEGKKSFSRGGWIRSLSLFEQPWSMVWGWRGKASKKNGSGKKWEQARYIFRGEMKSFSCTLLFGFRCLFMLIISVAICCWFNALYFGSRGFECLSNREKRTEKSACIP